MFQPPSFEQGLYVFDAGRIPATAGLDRPPVETGETRSDPEEYSTDLGSTESVGRTQAARRRTLGQTPVGQSHHASLPLQRQSHTDRLSAGCSVTVKSCGLQENRECRRSVSVVSLDGPEFSKLVRSAFLCVSVPLCEKTFFTQRHGGAEGTGIALGVRHGDCRVIDCNGR